MNGAAEWDELHGLPARWAGRDRFVVVDSRDDVGTRFLALWQAWRDDPARCRALHVIAIAQDGWRADRLRGASAATPLGELAARLIDPLSPAAPGMHRLAFEDGRLQLLLAVAAPADWARDIVARADVLALDVADLCSKSGWNPRRIRSFARLAAEGATLTIEAAPTAVPAACALADLAQASSGAGFRIAADSAPPRQDGRRTLLAATFTPAFAPREPAAGRPGSRPGDAADEQRHAIVVGAGLAGCATAWALAEHGWRTTLIDRQPTPAAEASGNPGGVFHGVFHPGDGVHARFNRAAALEARRAVRHAVEAGGVAGATNGLLRLAAAGDTVEAMHQRLGRSGLPPDYVQAVDDVAAAALCGVALGRPAWFFPGGGWVEPGGLARSFLLRAGSHTRFVPERDVAALHDVAPPGEKRPLWRAVDSNGAVLAEAGTVVLANAGDALRLAGWPWHGIADGTLGCRPVRGQISVVAEDAAGMASTRLPITGAGYVLPPSRGRIVFGATAQPDDPDPAVRPADHAHNLQQLADLIQAQVALDPADCDGRTAWRWVTDDRLPLIGGVPAGHAGVAERSPAAPQRRLDQPRWVPRVPGLYLYAGLGSRGIAWSALGAQIVAAWVSGAPAPVAAALLDAVDPGRLVARAVRRDGSR